MKYNFDEMIDRHGTQSVKYDTTKELWGREDVLPLWIADMDFKTPSFITDVIKERLSHEILGYPKPHDGYFEAFINWADRRYGMQIKKEEIHHVPGIVPGIYMMINHFSNPGDKVMVQPPVYHPFHNVIAATGRQAVHNSLIIENGRYRIDFDAMRRDIKGCKIFVLCNPHNPGGRRWSNEELTTMAEICAEEGTLVLSDEIHADMTYPPARHLPFAASCEKARSNSITFMAPSKTFNMPGVVSSQIIIFNEEIRNSAFPYLDNNHISGGNVFAFVTAEAAYNQGEEWLNQMLSYVFANMDYVNDRLNAEMPKIKAMKPEASFLMFFDCRELGFATQKELDDFFVNEARLALNSGDMFGPGGEGWMRFNAASPRAVMVEAMNRLKVAYDKRGF